MNVGSLFAGGAGMGCANDKEDVMASIDRVMSFDEWKAQIFENVDEVGRMLQPEADWTPVLIFDQGDSGGVMSLVGFEGQKGLGVVTAAVTRLEPIQIARVEMAWASPDAGVAPSEHPEKEEVLVVQFAEQGAYGRYELWWGDVERRENEHPQIARWTQITGFGGPVAVATRTMMQTLGRLN